MVGPDAADDVCAQTREPGNHEFVPAVIPSDALDESRPMPAIQRQNAVLQHLSLQDEELFRGVPVALVLQRLGAVLQESTGCTQDLHVRKSQRFDAFISHNWSASRARKFLSLAFAFNLASSWALTLLMQVVIFLLIGFNVLPITEKVTIAGEVKPQSIWCLMLGFGVFWATMLCSHDCSALWGRKRPLVFLDKMSIHQEDLALKQKGIDSLPAFLARSNKLVCVLGREYLHKLWTMFELCTFLAVHPPNRVQMQPIFLAVTSTIGCVVIQVGLVVWNLSRMHPGSPKWISYSVHATMSALSVCLGWVMRSWGRERELFVQQANDFNLAEAVCSQEADRAKVQAVIADFARVKLVEGDDASTHDCVEAFEAQVRLLVPAALNVAFGPTGVPRRFTSVLVLPVFTWVMDRLALEFRETLLVAERPRDNLMHMLTQLCVSLHVLALALLAIGASAWLGGRLGMLRGVAERLRIFICALPLLVLVSICIAVARAGNSQNLFVRSLAAAGVLPSMAACVAIHRNREATERTQIRLAV